MKKMIKIVAVFIAVYLVLDYVDTKYRLAWLPDIEHNIYEKSHFNGDYVLAFSGVMTKEEYLKYMDNFLLKERYLDLSEDKQREFDFPSATREKWWRDFLLGSPGLSIFNEHCYVVGRDGSDFTIFTYYKGKIYIGVSLN